MAKSEVKSGAVSKIKKAFSYGIKSIMTGAMCLSLGAHLRNCSNDLINSIAPSKQRLEFEKEFGFPLLFWEEDIAKAPWKLSDIAYVLHYEKETMPFDISSLKIVSANNFFRQSLTEQMNYSLIGIDGHYIPYFDEVGIRNDTFIGYNLHHEICHAKHASVETPTIMGLGGKTIESMFEEISMNKDGTSPYIGKIGLLIEMITGKAPKLDRISKDYPFASDYSSVSSTEDIAEICAMTSMANPRNLLLFSEWLGNDQFRREKIIAKVELLEQKGLVPRGFQEYVKLYSLLHSYGQPILSGTDSYPPENIAEQFFKESARFLKKYPGIVYSASIHRDREWLFRNNPSGNRMLNLELAIGECESMLHADYKPKSEYIHALRTMREIHLLRKENEIAAIYDAAYSEFAGRYYSGDIMLPKTGVNDFIENCFDELSRKNNK